MQGTVRAKLGVHLNLKPEIISAYEEAEEIYGRLGYECVITSGTDGTHMWGSLHYGGQAIDLRTRMLPDGVDDVIAAELRLALGDTYDVVAEETHLHLEFDPS